MEQQLTAIEWIELIADPEIREIIVDAMNKYPDRPYVQCTSIRLAVMSAIDFKKAPKQLGDIWVDMVSNPPALLPFPNKEREQAEAVLKEFMPFFNSEYELPMPMRQDDIDNFLNQKYPS